jgi:hypothetical protein
MNKMRLKDVKIGDKFYFLKEDNTADRMYLRIDVDASKLFITTQAAEAICGLDLTTYQVKCFNANCEAEVEYDNIYI